MYGELFPARREKSRVNYFKTGVNNVRWIIFSPSWAK